LPAPVAIFDSVSNLPSVDIGTATISDLAVLTSAIVGTDPGGAEVLRAQNLRSGAATFTGPITSTVATGTAPITVASTTVASNLNADMVDGQHLADLDTRYVNATGDTMTGALVVGTDPGGTEMLRAQNVRAGATTLIANLTAPSAVIGTDPGGTEVLRATTLAVEQSIRNVLAATDTPFPLDARAWGTPGSPTAGYFANYDSFANVVIQRRQAEAQPTTSGATPSLRDVLFVQHQDNDTQNYQTNAVIRQSQAIRAFTTGRHDGTTYITQYKDLVGIWGAAVGRVGWADRGVSGILADAVQYGSGIASNEFAAENAEGAAEASVSMAAVQAIVRARFADEDLSSGRKYVGVLVTNHGKRISAGVRMEGTVFGSMTPSYRYGVDMAPITIDALGAAIRMPRGAAGNQHSIIEYDANDYTFYDRAADEYHWVSGGNDLALLSATINANETALWLRRNVAGTFSLVRVSMGAPDSGGTGFRVLRVPNA
jgi:hypothetical protein